MVIQKRSLSMVLCALLLALPLQTAAAQGGAAELSLEECLRMALANNLELVSASLDPKIAEQGIERNLAPFDGVVGAGADYSDNSSDSTIEVVTQIPGFPDAQTDIDAASDNESLNPGASFDHLLKFGGSYSFGLSLTDQDDARTSFESVTQRPSDTSSGLQSFGYSLNYSMPLLNGFGTEVNTINLVLARSGLEVSREDLRSQAMFTLNNVEDAYWDVQAAREALRVERLALERAQDLLDLNKKKVEVGTLAPIEITQAEAGVASQEENVIIAEVNLENAEDALLELLAIPEASPMWEQSLALSDRPSFAPVDVELDAAIATALDNRPEIATAQRRLRDNELSERVAKKATRHGLDLTASITRGDFDNDELRTNFEVDPVTLMVVPVTTDTTTEGDSTNWTIGLRYSYPLRNRDAKANYAIARLNTEKTDVALRAAEQTVRVDVRTAVRNLESGLKRVAAAGKNVELQRKKLDAEQKKFENGMSTSFEVLEFQNDLASAELSEIRAKLDYVKSLAAFERAKGTLLEARGMTLAP